MQAMLRLKKATSKETGLVKIGCHSIRFKANCEKSTEKHTLKRCATKFNGKNAVIRFRRLPSPWYAYAYEYVIRASARVQAGASAGYTRYTSLRRKPATMNINRYNTACQCQCQCQSANEYPLHLHPTMHFGRDNPPIGSISLFFPFSISNYEFSNCRVTFLVSFYIAYF